MLNDREREANNWQENFSEVEYCALPQLRFKVQVQVKVKVKFHVNDQVKVQIHVYF